jgi:hypothetical protein
MDTDSCSSNQNNSVLVSYEFSLFIIFFMMSLVVRLVCMHTIFRNTLCRQHRWCGQTALLPPLISCYLQFGIKYLNFCQSSVLSYKSDSCISSVSLSEYLVSYIEIGHNSVHNKPHHFSVRT